jgi:hypothetical protein
VLFAVIFAIQSIFSALSLELPTLEGLRTPYHLNASEKAGPRFPPPSGNMEALGGNIWQEICKSFKLAGLRCLPSSFLVCVACARSGYFSDFH